MSPLTQGLNYRSACDNALVKNERQSSWYAFASNSGINNVSRVGDVI